MQYFSNINVNVVIGALPSWNSLPTFSEGSRIGATGVVRLAGLMTSLVAIGAAAELAFRGCECLASTLAPGSWTNSTFGQKVVKTTSDLIERVRPYKDTTKYSILNLIQKIIVCGTIGILCHESVRLVAGEAPAAYNAVLGLISPFQLNPGSTYLSSLVGRLFIPA